MKKSTIKTPKSPAPATKAAVSAAVKTAPIAKSGVTKIKAISPSIQVKPIASAPLVTSITAVIDVGYGNALYLRGEGPGLSWAKGVQLDSVAGDRWTIALPEAGGPVVFKFLINDITWSSGEDYTVAPGTGLTVTPVF